MNNRKDKHVMSMVQKRGMTIAPASPVDSAYLRTQDLMYENPNMNSNAMTRVNSMQGLNV